MADIIQLRRDTASDWTAAATVLLDGEIGIETDTNTFKVGNGVTAWASLSYYTGSLTLDVLDNVTITSNAAGEILKWNGSAWINQTLAEAGIQQPPAEGAFADGDKTKLDGAIQNGIIAAKGDLIGASANDTPVILSVGANDFVLTADSTQASGMKWAESGGGYSQDISLLYLYTAENKADRLNMIDGIIDPFDDATDVDAAGSTNATHNASTNLYSITPPPVGYSQMPFMSSNSQNGVVTSAISETNSSNAAWMAARGDGSTTGWLQTGSTLPSWWKIDFGAATSVTSYRLIGTHANYRSPDSWTIEGSADDSTWVVLGTETGQTWTQYEEKSFTMTEGNYRYFRINISAWDGSGSYSGFQELNLFGGGENVIPTTTAATTGDVVVTQSSNYSSGSASWKVFDRTNGGWIANGTTAWVQVDLGSGNSGTPVGFSLFTTTTNTTRMPKDFTVEGSNDGSTWTVLSTQTGQIFANYERKDYAFTNTTAYRYFKLDITLNNGAGSYVQMAEFILFAAEATSADMTLISNSFTANAEPTTARIGLQVIENESITINTDLTAEVSRDGGTTFTTAVLVLVDTLAGGTKYYEDEAVTISGQPSGTTMKYRIKTLNEKSMDISAALLQWG
jgi:hypothetical protein